MKCIDDIIHHTTQTNVHKTQHDDYRNDNNYRFYKSTLFVFHINIITN